MFFHILMYFPLQMKPDSRNLSRSFRVSRLRTNESSKKCHYMEKLLRLAI